MMRAAVAATVVVFPNVAFGEPISVLLAEVLETHDRIKTAEAELDAARFGIDEAKADYLPSLDVVGDVGHERQNKPTGFSDTATGFSEGSLTASQLLWDFGKTFKQIDRERLRVARAEVALESVKQAILREAVAAYLNLLRTADTLRFTRLSEQNIKRQTGLEEALVERQSGLQTDVLQAKSSLAGAAALRVRAEGDLSLAINRYRSVFKREVGDLSTYRRPGLKLDALPATVEDVVETSLVRNLELGVALLDVDVTKETTKIDKTQLYGPTLELRGELNQKRNVDGVLGSRNEQLVKLQFSFPLATGGRDTARYRGSLRQQMAASRRVDDLRRTVEERARNAWERLSIARANTLFLHNQANIAGEFLDLAREERRLGTRSLIDILNAETNFVNANSAALASETDMALAYYDLLFSMGALTLEAIGS